MLGEWWKLAEALVPQEKALLRIWEMVKVFVDETGNVAVELAKLKVSYRSCGKGSPAYGESGASCASQRPAWKLSGYHGGG